MVDLGKIDFIKFYSINKNLKKALNAESIYAAPINKLNDPVEKIEHVNIIKSNAANYSVEYRNKCGVFLCN
jgi:hypothetical protein